jgi:hypothetical protein
MRYGKIMIIIPLTVVFVSAESCINVIFEPLQIKEKVADLNTAWEALLKTFEQYQELCEQNLEAQVRHGQMFVF